MPSVADRSPAADSGQVAAWVSEIASADRFDKAPEALRLKVLDEQVRSLYAVSRQAWRTSMLFAALVLFNFFGRVPLQALLGWFAAMAAVALMRHLVARRFLRLEPAPASFPALSGWARRAQLLMGLQSLGWVAMLGLTWFTGSPVDVAFVVFLVCALTFGGFAALGFYLPAYLTFVVPLFAALWVWLVCIDPAESIWLAVIVAVGALAIFDSAVKATRAVRGALLLGHQHEALIERLTDEKERVQVTLRSIGDAVLTTDVTGVVTYLNPVAERLTGWSNEEACGRPLTEVLRLLDEASREPLPDPVGLCLDRQGLLVLEQDVVLIDRSGELEAAVEVTVSPIRRRERELLGVVLVAHDVTELRGMARVVSYQANHDPLTGLVNRRQFESRLWQALESARVEGLEHAMCYLDLDQFKLVNDTCGHVAGDELLKQTADLLLRKIRDTDTLARMGGDEFGLLLHCCDLDRARVLAEELCAAVREMRFEWDDKTFTLGVSIGVVPVDGSSTPSDLLAAADAACYVAKDHGRSRVHSGHPQDRELATRHGEMQWTTRIQRALDRGLFRLRMQRIEPLCADEPVLAELLVSMVGEQGELIAPGLFLPAAERFNMISQIDRRVLRLAFERVAARERSPQLQGIDRFTVNLSGQSISEEDFLGYVLRQFDETGVDPRRICLEITETAVIANLARARRFIGALRERGCTFALDDFGSGLSSFGYLRNLPVDYLKIDGLFVRNMGEDAINHSMVEAIHRVGHVMGIKTIAEFVENADTREALRALGVDYAQGFALHRPELLE